MPQNSWGKALVPRPTTTCFVQHWSFQPNSLPQPSSSYTAFVIAAMLGYDKVGRGRKEGHHTPSFSYPVLPQPISSYTSVFSHPTFPYNLSHPTTSYTGFFSHPRHPASSSTGLFSVGRRKVCGGVGYRTPV